jgi:hypothetical protein
LTRQADAAATLVSILKVQLVVLLLLLHLSASPDHNHRNSMPDQSGKALLLCIF